MQRNTAHPEGTRLCTKPTFISREGGNGLKKYMCTVCGYVYDPERGDPDGGVASGTAFEDLPDDWVCPECGVEKEQFEKV